MNEPELLVLFPSLIYSSRLEQVDNSYLATLAYSIRTLTAPSTKWHCPTYNTMQVWDWLDEPDIKVNQLVKQTADHVLNYADQLGDIDPAFNLQCQEVWFNIAGPGDYQEHHVHHDCNFSAVYYVTRPANSGNIMFTAPSWKSALPLPITPRPNNQFNYAVNYQVSPEAGQLLVFPGSLEHQVLQNISNEDRICVSMNFKFIKKPQARVI